MDDAKKKRVAAKGRKWYEANRDLAIARAKAHHEANRDKKLAYLRRYREDHLEEDLQRSRRWKANNAERHRASSRQYGSDHKKEISEKMKKWRRELKQAVLNAYGTACACCGEGHYELLTLDHINNDGAAHRRRLGTKQSHVLYRELIAQGFPHGYQVLCFNCNSAFGFYGYCPHNPHIVRTLARGMAADRADHQGAQVQPQAPDSAPQQPSILDLFGEARPCGASPI